MQRCDAWKDKAAKKPCEDEGIWRPVLLFRAPKFELARAGRHDTPISVKLRLALCSAHKDALDYHAILMEAQQNGASLFETVARAIQAFGLVRPELKRTELAWEDARSPFSANWQDAQRLN